MILSLFLLYERYKILKKAKGKALFKTPLYFAKY
nr:MAG TPA_asm: hypothetical protein [Inoviridae sp.]